MVRGRHPCPDSTFTPSLALTRTSADAVAAELAQSTLPVGLFGHSAGSWIMWEFMKQLDLRGLPKPAIVFASTFPAPTIPVDAVPWRKNRDLTDDEFKVRVLAVPSTSLSPHRPPDRPPAYGWFPT